MGVQALEAPAETGEGSRELLPPSWISEPLQESMV